MSEKRISAHGTFLLYVLLLAALSRTGLAQSFDNFNAPKISPANWLAGEGASQLGLEVTRAIENGQLRLRTRSVGSTTSDSGLGTNFVFLGLPHPEDAAGSMAAAITATNINDVGCSANTENPTQSFAGVVGSFFNAGMPQNGDATNDVIAAVGISSDSVRITAGEPPQIVSYVLQCTNQSCDTFTLQHSHSFGPIALGARAKVQMFWNPLDHRFDFIEKDASRGTVFDSYLYRGVLTDTSSPGIPFKHLQAQNNVANCTNLNPRPVASVSALFDNVGWGPACQLPGTACTNASTCCDGSCAGPGSTCCVQIFGGCSSDQDCCGPNLACGSSGDFAGACCLAIGAITDDPSLCCNGTCGPSPFPDACACT